MQYSHRLVHARPKAKEMNDETEKKTTATRETRVVWPALRQATGEASQTDTRCWKPCCERKLAIFKWLPIESLLIERDLALVGACPAPAKRRASGVQGPGAKASNCLASKTAAQSHIRLPRDACAAARGICARHAHSLYFGQCAAGVR